VALADVLTASRVFPTTPISTSAGMLPLRVVMVAIAGAEDNFTNGPGDKINGSSIPYTTWNCNGYTSLGTWQIHIPVHFDLVTKLMTQSGAKSVTDPCAMAQWLSNYQNCAGVAAYIAGNDGGGLSAWTTWNDGSWKQFIPQGLQSVSSITTGVPMVPVVSPTQPVSTQPLGTQTTTAAPIVVPSMTVPTVAPVSLFGLQPKELTILGLALVGVGYVISRS